MKWTNLSPIFGLELIYIKKFLIFKKDLFPILNTYLKFCCHFSILKMKIIIQYSYDHIMKPMCRQRVCSLTCVKNVQAILENNWGEYSNSCGVFCCFFFHSVVSFFPLPTPVADGKFEWGWDFEWVWYFIFYLTDYMYTIRVE